MEPTQYRTLRRHMLGDLLRRTAARTPASRAIVHADVSWTYAELDTVCNRIARGLAARGLRRGDRLALLSRNSHHFVAIRFAVARLGAVLVPVNFMLTAEEVGYVLGHSAARMLCVEDEFAPVAQDAVTGTAVETVIRIGGDGSAAPAGWIPVEQVSSTDEQEPIADLDTGDVAQIIYTSGTESRPKGAMLTHDAVIWQYVSCIIDAEIAADDVLLHALPLYHCAQLDVFLGPAVYVGASNVIVAQPQPEVVLPMIARHQVTSFFAPPTVWIALLRSPLFDQTDLSSLRKGYYGAAIMPVEVLGELGRRLPNVRFWNLYGQTEIAPLATVLKPDDQIDKAGSAGHPALNVETRVVDDAGHPVQPGAIGEIVHRSPQLLQGYYEDPERTATAFEGGWFHSGDLATVDDEGYITIVDRKKDMIKTGGENVASREVEEIIYGVDAVSEVAVIGVPHPYWIEEVVAVIVRRSGQTLTEDEVIAHCRAHLAGFKVPKRVVFLEALPKNPSGKVLKRDLRLSIGSDGVEPGG
jgi:fatty-acyl-CoA synthase